MSIKTLIYISLIIAIIYGLFTIGLPFLLAFLLAVFLEPLIIRFSKWTKLNRPNSAVIVCSLFIVIISTIGYFLIAKVAQETLALSGSLRYSTTDIYKIIDIFTATFNRFFFSIPPEYHQTLQDISQGLIDNLQNLFGQIATLFFNIAKQIPNILLQILIMFIALYLISINLPQKKAYIMGFFDPKVHSRLETVLKKLHEAVIGFIQAQLIISFFIFIVVLIGFLILDIPYASALALIITVVDFLPVLGTGSIMIPMAIYQYFIGNIFLGTALLIHYLIIVAFRRIIEPKIISQSIGIGPLSTLISMYVGFKLTGFIGIFLGPAIIIIFLALHRVGLLKINIRF